VEETELRRELPAVETGDVSEIVDPECALAAIEAAGIGDLLKRTAPIPQGDTGDGRRILCSCIGANYLTRVIHAIDADARARAGELRD
jgi:hypothetical protein